MKNTKRILAAVFALIMALSMVVPTFAATVKVTSVTLGHTSLKLIPGKSYTEKATVKPTNATNKAVTWKSSNTKIVTVNQSGTITGKAMGTATVTVTAKDGSKKTASCKVTVGKPVTSVKLNATAKTLYTGKTFTLKPTFAPTDAVNKLVLWSSSNTKIATVSSSGVVTAKAKGTATITCTTRDGSGKKATCKITVVQSVTSIKLDRTAINATKYGLNYRITPTIAPTNAYKKTVTWTSSNTKVAAVSTTGVVKTKAYGTATITCTAADGSGKKATCKVTVSNPAVTVSLNKTVLNSVTLGAKYTLKATVKPAKATVKWTSSNTAVATVDSKGVVTTKNNGKSTITCTVSYGGTVKKATCAVTVRVQVKSVTLNKVSFSTKEIGTTCQLKATIAPSNAGVKTVTWSTSDKNVATVSANGLVTATGYGTATITCTAMDKKTAVCTVKVIADVEGIVLEETEINADKLGEIYTLVARIHPVYAMGYTIEWSSKDTSVATVDKDGKVTIKGNGTTVITATAGGFSATCTVNVKLPLEELSFEKSAFAEKINKKFTLEPVTKPASNGVYDFTWTSSNPDIATVDEKGQVSLIGYGEVKITCSYEDKTADYTVTVIPGLNKDIIDDAKIGESFTLSFTKTPEEDVTWTTSDASIATVDNGVVSYKNIGCAVITAQFGEYSSQCKIYVTDGTEPENYNKNYKDLFTTKNFTASAQVSISAEDLLEFKDVIISEIGQEAWDIITEIGTLTVNVTVGVKNGKPYAKINTTSLNDYVNNTLVNKITDEISMVLGLATNLPIKELKLKNIRVIMNNKGAYLVIDTEKFTVEEKFLFIVTSKTDYNGIYYTVADLINLIKKLDETAVNDIPDLDSLDVNELVDYFLDAKYLCKNTKLVGSKEYTVETFITKDNYIATMYFDKDGVLEYVGFQNILIKVTEIKAGVNEEEFAFSNAGFYDLSKDVDKIVDIVLPLLNS